MSGPIPLPPDEEERLAALRSYGILDTAPETAFDDITLLASYITGTPTSLITLLDESRQWFKSKVGMKPDETDREIAFCAHAIMGRDVMQVDDAHKDERFADNPLVTGDPNIRFYAGAPLVTPEGHALGTLCVIDKEPRHLDKGQEEALQALGRQVVAQLELRRAIKGLAQLRREFEMILNSAAEGIYGLDKNGRVNFINAAGARMCGYEPSELMRQRHHDLVHHSRPNGSPYPWQDCPNHRTLTTGNAMEVTGELFWRRDGTSFPVDYSSTPIVNDGIVTGAVVIFRDATERLQVQKMKDDLVSVVSHELRTPLTSIMGYLDALLEGEAGELEEEQEEYAEIAYRNAKKLHGLISDLLTLSRLESGKLNLKPSEFELTEMLHAIVQEQQPIARDKDVTVSIEAPEQIVLEGDAARLQQVFANLLSNAIKFSPAGEEIKIEGGQLGDRVVVRVSDRGVGIPKEEVPKLFERFFRASTAGMAEGTGLGLSISKEIVERHDGSLEVETEEGAGSTFTVELPVRSAG